MLHSVVIMMPVAFYSHAAIMHGVCVLMPVAVCLLSTGLVAATFGTPADVIKTRVMNQPTDPATGTHAPSSPAHPPKGVQV